MTYLRAYRDSPDLMPAVRELLGVVFPGTPAKLDAGAAIGLRWDRMSTPFVAESKGRVIAHVGVLEMTFVLNDAEVDVGIVHGVMTDPAHRGRGHFRALMDDALAWCAPRYDTLILNTGSPSLYEPFGFRRLPESRFVRAVAHPGKGHGWRRLDYGDAADVERLGRLLARRAPVSRRVGVVREHQAFAFNRALDPPCYSAELDALACMELEGTTLRLYDVVAPALPTLDRIVARIERPLERVECYVSADQLDAESTPEPHVLFGDENLMVRGPFPPEGEPFMLAQPARC